MRRNGLFLILGLMLLLGCRDKELDMTLVQKTMYEGATIDEITVKDAWDVVVVQDENTFVELEYSAFLEDYLKIEKEGTAFSIGFTSHFSFPSSTVMNVKIHTPEVHHLKFSDAVFAALDGLNVTDITLELEDAAACRGGHFYGSADIELSDASKCVEFYFEGTTCKVELEDASDFKGCLKVTGDLTMTIEDASHATDYWGEINHADVEVSDASYLNMATSWINRMNIRVKDASEATVNVTEWLEGFVHDASTLYYSGDPVLNVDCDTSSTLQQVDYPNP